MKNLKEKLQFIITNPQLYQQLGGSYFVTFDVAAWADWKEAKGLYAGYLTIGADFSFTVKNNSNITVTGIIIGDGTTGFDRYIKIPISLMPSQTSEILGTFPVFANYGGNYYQITLFVRTENSSWDDYNDYSGNMIWRYGNTNETPPSFITLEYPRRY